MKKKGFTLVELLAVIVILAIIALITIPIVIKTINNSEEEAEKKSVLGYARAIENDIANYKMLNPGKSYKSYPFKDETKEEYDYNGNDVVCIDKKIDENDKLVLMDCYVVKDRTKKITPEEIASKNHYNYINGKVEKMDDYYAISDYASDIEEDIVNWKKDNQEMQYSEYDFSRITNEKVECEIKNVSNDGKLTLGKCYIKDVEQSNREYYNYANGLVTKEGSNTSNNSSSNGNSDNNTNNSSTQTTYTAYSVGDEITVAGEQYYVIANSDSTKDYVTALKANPLTVAEVNLYGGVGTSNNHVNQYINNPQRTAYDWNDTNHTGGMAYYSSSTCGYNGGGWVYDGCTTDYATSEVKYVIDGWAAAKFTNGELKTVDGYGARLATKEELQPIGWPSCSSTATSCSKETDTPSWIWNSSYWYWTMSQWNNTSSKVWDVDTGGSLSDSHVGDDYGGCYVGAVRPVLNIYKSKI